MMVLLKIGVVISVFVTQTLSSPFLYNAPQALTSLVSSASSASSAPVSNIADLTRPLKLQQSLEDDDFFKDSAEKQQDVEEEMTNEATPNLLRKKINKIVDKIRFLSTITSRGGDDDAQKEQDDFDREFNEDFVEGSGYVYEKPMKNAKQETSNNGIGFNPANIGVFFMELIGSLVGLAYGAAAQLNYPGSTTTQSSV